MWIIPVLVQQLLLKAIMQLALRDNDSGVRVDDQLVSNLRFADDIDLIAESVDQLQDLTDRVNDSSKKFGLEVNVQKTKTMTNGKNIGAVDNKARSRCIGTGG